MAFVEPPAGRAKIQSDGLALRVSIPPHRSLFAVLFLGAWMVGWYFGETSALREFMKPGRSPQGTFLVAWLVGWTIGGIFAATTLLWSLAGGGGIEGKTSVVGYPRRGLGMRVG